MLVTMYACLKGLGFTVYFLFIFIYGVFVKVVVVGVFFFLPFSLRRRISS